MNDQTLKRVRAAIAADDKATARRLLVAALNEDPRDIQAWLRMAQAVSDPRRKRQCLETVLEINPENERAKAQLLRLQAQEMASEEQQNAPEFEKPEPSIPVSETISAVRDTASTVVEQNRHSKWRVFAAGGVLLVFLCCGVPLALLTTSAPTLGEVISDEGDSSNRRVIPPTYTPGSGSAPAISGGPSSGSGEYGEIAISRTELAEYAERSALGMSFYRDLEYTDGTYHHTMCTRNCEQKLVMRSETFDRDDLDNLDYSFIYDDDEFVERSLALLIVVAFAIPEWGEAMDQWYLDSYESFLLSGQDTFYASRNGIDVQLDFFYDSIDLEDVVLVSVAEYQ